MLSCNGEDESAVQAGSIDEEYLKSQAYQSFKKQSQEEQARATRLRRNFIAFVEEKINSDANFRSFSIPVEISAGDIHSVLSQEPTHRSAVTSTLGYEQIYHPLAKMNNGGIQYYLFLTCKVASYKDCLVWFASMMGENLVQLRMIATYKRTLSYRENPEIRLDSSAISIDIQRSVEYPLTALSSYSLRFDINGDGQIFRVQHN